MNSAAFRARRAAFGLPAALVLLALAAAPLRAAEPPATPAPTAQDKPEGREVFRAGYAFFAKGRYAEASATLYGYVSTHSPDDEDYDWALFFFGISLYQLGYTHASADTLAYLVGRKPNVRIVSYSLEVLEHLTRTAPFDWETVVLDALVDQEYGFVDPGLNDFVNYYQGLYDWEHGYREWGTRHFEQIRPDSFYRYKYRYQHALYEIYGDQLGRATMELQRLVADPAPPESLKDEARATLARILYEQGRYDEADAAYRGIQKPNVEQARYLLERAWAQYRLNDPEKAMGLLYAFRAPTFERDFTPEYFILKSLIYKQVCQYRNALGVVDEFRSRYGAALDHIYRRGEPLENEALLEILMEKTRIHRLYAFLRLLERERQQAASAASPELTQHLDELYRLKIEETTGELRTLVGDDYEALASELLKYEEEAHLLEYEVGLDMYQRASDYHFEEGEKAPVPPGEGPAAVAAYPFQGEFWNDELDDYQVVLKNQCENLQEWDIFFR